ncbi:MAG: TetR/AcrR family transcriptional regulator [Nitrospinae bacterium]|nr:TetR/AcrR family transcriptional regulator [Nitrospinota bacterium]
MAITKTDTKEKIVSFATQLIETKGYNGFSYQDIADELGIKKASIHYHFPSKEDLGIAVFEAFMKGVHEHIAQIDFESLTAAEKLAGYFQYHAEVTLVKNHDASDCSHISCIGALTSEWNNLPEKMREQIDNFNNWHVGFVASIISDGVAKKEFCHVGSVEGQALLIIAATKGALLLSREKTSIEIYNQITRQLIEGLKCK